MNSPRPSNPGVRPLSTDDIPSVLVGDLYRRGQPLPDPVVLTHRDNLVSIDVELSPHPYAVQCHYWYGRYWHTREGEESSSTEDTYFVRISVTQANLGGVVMWLHCRSCGRRARRLFLVPDFGPSLVCQKCSGVPFPSRVYPRHVTRMRRARRIREQLGASAGLLAALPERPRGMRRQRYERLCDEVRAIETAEWARIQQHERRSGPGKKRPE